MELTPEEFHAWCEGRQELVRAIYNIGRFQAWVNTAIHGGKKSPKRPQDLLSFPWDEDATKEIDMDEIRAKTEAVTKAAQAKWDKIKAQKNKAK